MKKLMLLLGLFISFTASAQVYQEYTQHGASFNGLSAKRAITIPTRCGGPNWVHVNDSMRFQAGFMYDSCAKRLWVYDPKLKAWDTAHIGPVTVAVPTWQQALIAGRTLTEDNTIPAGGFNWTWNNLGHLTYNLAANKALNINTTGDIEAYGSSIYLEADDGFGDAYFYVYGGTAEIYSNLGGAIAQLLIDDGNIELLAQNDITLSGANIFAGTIPNDNTETQLVTLEPVTGKLEYRTVASLGIGGGSNFANADLTLTANRNHDGGAFTLLLDNFSNIELNATDVVLTAADLGAQLNVLDAGVMALNASNTITLTTAEVRLSENSLAGASLGYVWTLTNTGNGAGEWAAPPAGAGTVTDFIFTDGNGLDGTVSTSTTTPTLAITSTVGDNQVFISNGGAFSGSNDLVFDNTDLIIKTFNNATQLTGLVVENTYSGSAISSLTFKLNGNTIGTFFATNFSNTSYGIADGFTLRAGNNVDDIGFSVGDNYAGSGAGPQLLVTPSALLVNDGGINYDFRIEGDLEQNLFFTDASTDRVGIGTNSPQAQLHTTSTVRLAGIGGAGLVVSDADGDLSVTTVTQSTYTPTAFNTTNITASTPGVTHYLQVGDWVHVWGTVAIDATTALTISEMGLSLPVTTGMGNVYDLAGTATFEDNTVVQIKGDVANARAVLRFTPQSATNNTYSFHFSYKYIAP